MGDKCHKFAGRIPSNGVQNDLTTHVGGDAMNSWRENSQLTSIVLKELDRDV
jgi:hypothetical protein